MIERVYASTGSLESFTANPKVHITYCSCQFKEYIIRLLTQMLFCVALWGESGRSSSIVCSPLLGAGHINSAGAESSLVGELAVLLSFAIFNKKSCNFTVMPHLGRASSTTTDAALAAL